MLDKPTDHICSVIHESLENARKGLDEVFANLSGFQLDFMEVCCGPDSGLTAAVRAMGGTGERIGLQNKMDLTTPIGV